MGFRDQGSETLAHCVTLRQSLPFPVPLAPPLPHEGLPAELFCSSGFSRLCTVG